MTHSLFVHTDSERSERTSTPPLRRKTPEPRESPLRPTQTRPVSDAHWLGLDLCRWETEGGALAGTDSVGTTGFCRTGNDILPTDSQTVQLAKLASPNNRLAGRPARLVPAEWPDENRAEGETGWSSAEERPPSMRLGHVHLKIRDLNRSVRFYTSVLDLRLTEQTERYAFLAIGTEHHSLALEEIGARAAAPSRHAVGMAHLAFEVPDRVAFVAAHDRLWKASIPISCADKGISWTMRFEDPDGNEIEVYLDRRKALDGTALWEGRWHAFPTAPRGVVSLAAKVASHQQTAIDEPRANGRCPKNESSRI